MGLFSKLFGSQDTENQKNKKFHEFEKQWADDQGMMLFSKAAWLTSRGNHYGQQGNLGQAITDFKEAIELKADYVPAYLSLGIAYREKGTPKEAIEIINKAPRKMRTSGKERGGFEFELYNVLGTSHLMLGDKPQALEYAKKALASVNDPERMEEKEFAKSLGLVDKDSKIVEVLKGIIKELEHE